MSTRRSATWQDSPHYGQRGPNGRRRCLECGEELSEKRKRFTFCSPKCRTEREIRSFPSAARLHVYQRDHGVCVRCGLDCEALDNAIREFGFTYESSGGPRGYAWMHGTQSMVAVRWLESQGFTRSGWVWKSTWQAHHKHAVVQGGGGCDLDGYITLCWRCHRGETRKLHSRIADARRGRAERSR
jgi:5-methylcytosine-specific restriction endonuclease McrA